LATIPTTLVAIALIIVVAQLLGELAQRLHHALAALVLTAAALRMR